MTLSAQQLVDLVKPCLPLPGCVEVSSTALGDLYMRTGPGREEHMLVPFACRYLLGAIAEACICFRVYRVNDGSFMAEAEVAMLQTHAQEGPSRLHAAVSAYLSAKGNT